MLRTKLRGNRSTGSRKEDFRSLYLSTWSCNADTENKLLFPLLIEALHEIWL